MWSRASSVGFVVASARRLVGCHPKSANWLSCRLPSRVKPVDQLYGTWPRTTNAPARTRRRFTTASVVERITPAKHSSALARNADKDAVCVIVGASRGIGLAITQQLFKRFKGRVFALCRDPEAAGALGALVQFNPHRMTILPIDTTDEQSVAAAAAQVKQISATHRDGIIGAGRIDLLIHTVGVLHDQINQNETGAVNRSAGSSGSAATTGAADTALSPPAVYMPETSLGRVRTEFLVHNLMVNTVGPLLVFKHFSPMMVTTRKEASGRVSPSVLATLTARVGSIEDNHIGGWISYRASKAAHNQVLRTASIELGRRGVACVALHPGTVNTDLSAPFQKNVPSSQLFAVDRAASMLLDVIDSLGPEDNGSFLDYKRDCIPW